MADILGLLWRLGQNRQKIERLISVSKKIWIDAQPEIQNLRRDTPELFEIGRDLIAVFAPQAQQFLAGIAPLAKVSVADSQRMLKNLGYYKGEIDNIYGRGTTEAVIQFQRDHDLEPDGWAGFETVPAIWMAFAERKRGEKK